MACTCERTARRMSTSTLEAQASHVHYKRALGRLVGNTLLLLYEHHVLIQSQSQMQEVGDRSKSDVLTPDAFLFCTCIFE
jgi:hypothetical protein